MPTRPATLLCACAALLAAAPPQATHRLPADDRIISAPFEDLFVAGKERGDDHEMLFGLVDVTFAPDGELYVLEERSHRVLVHGPDGEFRRSFGREGQGPGEFLLPMTLAVTSRGEIPVWDFQHTAYIVFDREGEYLRNAALDDWRAGPRRASMRAWPGGGVVHLHAPLHRDGDPPEDRDRGAIVHTTLSGPAESRELLVVRHPRRRGQEVAGVTSLTSGARFQPTARWDVVSDGRLAVADNAAYEVRIIEPASGDSTVVERPIAPRPVTETDRERERAKQRHSLENPAGAVSFGGGGGGGGITPRQISAILDAMEFAEVIPVIRDLRVDASDRLWIQRHGETPDDDGPIDVVTADGDYLGTLPPMPMPDAFGPDGLVAWMEGGRDVDVERVIVRRLPEPLR